VAVVSNARDQIDRAILAVLSWLSIALGVLSMVEGQFDDAAGWMALALASQAHRRLNTREKTPSKECR
jgi:hypothetical protein